MSDKREIRIGERLYSRWFLEQEAGQRTLSFAYREKLPVICLCNTIPMHIAKRQKFFIRKNPGTGALHHIDCPSFTQDYDERVVTESPKHSVVRDGAQITVIVGFEPPYLPGTHPVHVDIKNGISLAHLLGLIWRESGFNIHPTKSMLNTMDFGEHVQRVSEKIELAGIGQLRRFFVAPHAFDANHKNHANEREKLIDSFSDVHGSGRFMVIGIVKSCLLTHNKNTLIHLKYMPEYPFICHEQVKVDMERAAMGDRCDIILLCSVRKRGQYLIVDDIALLSVFKNRMLPIAHLSDFSLTSYLLNAGRKFIKPISANGVLLDGAFLTDCEGGCRIVFQPTHQSNTLVVGEEAGELKLPIQKVRQPHE